MFSSGRGIRTLTTSMKAYNPVSYRNGSVRPHDNAMCAAGPARYGYVEEARRVIGAQLRWRRPTGGRLPEVLAGSTAAIPEPQRPTRPRARRRHGPPPHLSYGYGRCCALSPGHPTVRNRSTLSCHRGCAASGSTGSRSLARGLIVDVEDGRVEVSGLATGGDLEAPLPATLAPDSPDRPHLVV